MKGQEEAGSGRRKRARPRGPTKLGTSAAPTRQRASLGPEAPRPGKGRAHLSAAGRAPSKPSVPATLSVNETAPQRSPAP